MSPKFKQFTSAVMDYPKFKAQFSSFCETIIKNLNNNSQLPGFSFSVVCEGTAAEVLILDQKFVVKFHLVVLNDERIGVLGAYLPTQGDEEILLWQTFFDIHGNVKDTPDASAIYNLQDNKFLDKLLGEFTDRYFSHLIETFKLTAPAQR